VNVLLTVAVCLPVVFGRRLSMAIALVLVVLVTAGAPAGSLTVVDLVIIALAPVAVWYWIRLQRERGEHIARLYIAEDRARLARDMHDSVGHHLTAIKMQAAAAQRVPEATDRALATIVDLSSTALVEVRDFVRELRTDIDELAERMSGPDRRITTRGTSLDLPPAVGHAAYRIVQEALTNAVRHSDATSIEVRLRRVRGGVVVAVIDNGSTGMDFVEGNGIRGIRERVGHLGGTVHIGPNGTGWLVEASLPA
jgi:signal transduction histidine kinase